MTSGKRNTVAKTTEFGRHVFYSDFDADVNGNKHSSRRGLSKNNLTCEKRRCTKAWKFHAPGIGFIM